ncbi:hypothetical protein [Nostoc sp. CMAA1605]|nr:hypothetical protein [Nostoc sp. CMAA1605]
MIVKLTTEARYQNSDRGKDEKLKGKRTKVILYSMPNAQCPMPNAHL